MSTTRPPGPQFLYDLGVEDSSDTDPPSPTVSSLPPLAPQPPMASCSPVPVPVSALTTMLPYREHAAPALTATAAAATIRQPVITDFPDRDAIASLEFSCDPFGPSFDEPVSLSGIHPTAGLDLLPDAARGHLRLRACLTATPAARILRWRSRIRHAFLIAIDGNPVHTIEDVQKAIATLRQTTQHTARFTFTHDEIRTNLTAEGVPQLYFDQLNHIRQHLEDIRSPKAHKLTRRTLTSTTDWPEWEASEYKQLNQFAQQGMFADPIPAPPPTPPSSIGCGLTTSRPTKPKPRRPVASVTVPLAVAKSILWTTPTPLASSRPACAFFFAPSALENKRIYGADVSNALHRYRL
jgi:hypothetical protein